MEIEQQAKEFQKTLIVLRDEIAKVIVGHQDVIEKTLVGFVAGGHVLLEGVPGLGKTLLVRTMADAVSVEVLAHPVHSRPDARRYHRHEYRGGRSRPQAL